MVLVLCFIASKAQDPCATYEYESYLEQINPGFMKALQESRNHALSSMSKLGKQGNDTVYRIPVVFHVVWNKDAENLDDSLILSQLEAINSAFRHNHKDTNKVRDLFKPFAGDTKIEFFMATEDPDGNATNGINRVKTVRSDFGSTTNLFAESVKSITGNGVDAWDTKKYLNIWVCEFTFRGTIVTAAYAFPPTGAQFWSSNNFTTSQLQGVVTNYRYVGRNNPNDNSNTSLREKTLIHEIGHYLGLRHIWADKRSTCIGQDDGIEDTPLAGVETRVCSTTKNSCNEGADDKPDMTENYMDYTPYPCTYMFTAGQSTLMRFNLLNLRSELPLIHVIKPPYEPYAQFSIYPNPSQNSITLRSMGEGDYTMVLSDMIGKNVKEETILVGETFEQKINTSTLSSGIYHIRILQNGSEVYHEKLIFQ